MVEYIMENKLTGRRRMKTNVSTAIKKILAPALAAAALITLPSCGGGTVTDTVTDAVTDTDAVTAEEKTYEVSGKYEERDGMYYSDETVKFTLTDVEAGTPFNRIRIGYRSTAPCVIDVALKKDSETNVERFFLEASGNGDFRGLISGFLSGVSADGIAYAEVSPLLPGTYGFGLGKITTETVQVPATDAEGNFYIENGDLRLGVRLAWGGGISYIADKHCKVERLENLINQHDTGRLVQQSYYGTPEIEGVYDPGVFNGAKWNYNPVQGGDVAGTPSRLIDLEIGADSVCVKTQAKDWALNGSLTPSYMENTYTLDGSIIRVDNRFVDFSGFEHPYLLQELPAFYTVSYLDTFVYYYGKKPWTEDRLTFKSDLTSWTDASGGENIFLIPRGNTETWAAWVDRDGYGIGVYTPNVDVFHAGRYKYDGSMSALSDSTNYLAPLSDIKLVSFEPVEYGYLITAGDIGEIRERFSENRSFSDNASLSKNRKPTDGVDGLFDMTDVDFSVAGAEKLFADPNGTDISYSESDRAAKLTVNNKNDVYVTLSFADNSDKDVKAEDYDSVVIEYMLPESNGKERYTAELFLACGEYGGAVAGNSVTADLIADGVYHKAVFSASSNKCWQGTVNLLRLDYFFDCAEGDCIYIRSLKMKKVAGFSNGKIIFDSEEAVSSLPGVNATDASYDPAENAMKLTVTGNDVNFTLIPGAFEDASVFSRIEIEYMIPETNKRSAYTLEMYLCAGNVTAPTEDNAVRAEYTADGGYHTAEIPMSSFKTHEGALRALRYDYFAAADAGDVLYVRSAAFIK